MQECELLLLQKGGKIVNTKPVEKSNSNSELLELRQKIKWLEAEVQKEPNVIVDDTQVL
jgi:hypothetical protein